MMPQYCAGALPQARLHPADCGKEEPCRRCLNEMPFGFDCVRQPDRGVAAVKCIRIETDLIEK
jgi:hypothetical protein